MLLLLAACGPDDVDSEAAVDLAQGILHEHEDPADALVHLHVVEGYPYEAAWGGATLEGVGLASWLAPCAVDPTVQIEAALWVQAGVYPWTILDTGGPPLDACVRDRLGRLPVEAPVAQGAEDLWLVRYKAGEAGPSGHVAGRVTGDPPVAGPALPAPSPPYVLFLKHGSMDWSHIRFEHGNVTWPQMEGSRVVTWNPETVARAVTCPDGALTLVRVVAEVERGDVVDVDTAPENECVAEKVRVANLAAIPLEDDRTVDDVHSALVVFDVPVGPW